MRVTVFSEQGPHLYSIAHKFRLKVSVQVFFFFFFFFLVFLKKLQPTPQPQQHEIQAASVTYITAHSNAGSLTR